MDLVEDYVKVIGYGKGAETYLRENGYVVKKEDYRGREYEALTGAAVLLFGKNPQRFFQRAQVRVVRYDGTEAKVGTEMNVVKDFHRPDIEVDKRCAGLCEDANQGTYISGARRTIPHG